LALSGRAAVILAWQTKQKSRKIGSFERLAAYVVWLRIPVRFWRDSGVIPARVKLR
jgi:hypothetical protein